MAESAAEKQKINSCEKGNKQPGTASTGARPKTTGAHPKNYGTLSKADADNHPKTDAGQLETSPKKLQEEVQKMESSSEEAIKEPETCSTDARPKSTGARPKSYGTPSKADTDGHPKTDFGRLEALSKKLQTGAQKMEKQGNFDFEYITKLCAPYTGDEDYVRDKYRQLYHQVRRLEVDQIRYNQLQIDHEQLRNEFAKMSTAHSRLENLCRAMQKQNKEIKEEAAKKLVEEEKKRKQLSGVFQENFEELSKIMEAGSKERYSLHDDNVAMTKTIQFLREKCVERDEQIALMKQESELQKKLYESDLAKDKLEERMEKQRREHDRKVLELTLNKSEHMCTLLQENLNLLREQTKHYAKKCEEYQNAIRKSNAMPENYQAEETEKIVALEDDAELANLMDDLKDLDNNTGEKVVKDSEDGAKATKEQVE